MIIINLSNYYRIKKFEILKNIVEYIFINLIFNNESIYLIVFIEFIKN